MLTERQIRCLFTKLNDLYFEGALPQPNRIEFRFVKKYLGQFHWDGRYKNAGTCIIRFSTAWVMTDFEVERVLIHEMIHEWQWVTGHNDHHGKYFKFKASQINHATNNKYNIARCTEIENKQCLKDKNKKQDFSGVVILYRRNIDPEKQYIAVCPYKSYKGIRSWFPKHRTIDSCEFYTATGDYLNNFSKSIRRIHGYPLTDLMKSNVESCIIRSL